MIVKHYELKKKLDLKKNFFLLYGNNKGLIEETIKQELKQNFSNNVYNYEENEILSNTEIFYDTIFNKSFFENEKLIIISRVSDKFLEIIKKIYEKKIEGLKIILKTEVLEKKSKLRNLFEKDINLIIIPFYEDNHYALNTVARKFITDNKIKIPQESINLIIERSKGDRINLLNELEKIKNFGKSKSKINFEDVVKLTNLAENYSMSELVDSSLNKNQKKTLTILNENNFNQEDCILISRIYLNKLKRLLKIYSQTELKNNIEEVLKTYKPPIFWKDKDIIKEQLKIWNQKKIEKLIVETNEIELKIKKTPSISVMLITDFVLENCYSANN